MSIMWSLYINAPQKLVNHQKLLYAVATQLLHSLTDLPLPTTITKINLNNFFTIKQTIWTFWVNDKKMEGVLLVTVIWHKYCSP